MAFRVRCTAICHHHRPRSRRRQIICQSLINTSRAVITWRPQRRRVSHPARNAPYSVTDVGGGNWGRPISKSEGPASKSGGPASKPGGPASKSGVQLRNQWVQLQRQGEAGQDWKGNSFIVGSVSKRREKFQEEGTSFDNGGSSFEYRGSSFGKRGTSVENRGSTFGNLGVQLRKTRVKLRKEG